MSFSMYTDCDRGACRLERRINEIAGVVTVGLSHCDRDVLLIGRATGVETLKALITRPTLVARVRR